MKQKVRWQKYRPYFYLLPAAIALGSLAIFPIGYNMYLSLHRWNWAVGQANEPPIFIGIENYLYILNDTSFWNSIWNTAFFTLGAVGIEFLLGLGCALLLNLEIRGSVFFRSAFIFPLMISDMVAALMGKMLFDPPLGPINYYLGVLGLPTPNWLGDRHIVMFSIILMDVWWATGNITLLLLAGLQGIPKTPVEAAVIDGASRWQVFRYITLPLLKPIIFVALLFRVLDALRVFALVWGTTMGGPARASEVVQLYIFVQGLGRFLKMGYSAALAVVFSAMVGVLILLYIKKIKLM